MSFKLVRFYPQIKDISKIRIFVDSRVPQLHGDSSFQETESLQSTLQKPSHEIPREAYQDVSEPLCFVPIFINSQEVPKIKINVSTSYPELEIFKKKSEEKSLQENADSRPLENIDKVKSKRNLEIKKTSIKASLGYLRIIKEYFRTIPANDRKGSVLPLLRTQVVSGPFSLDEICIIYIYDVRRQNFLVSWSLEARGKPRVEEFVGIDALKEGLRGRLLSYMDNVSFDRFFILLVKEMDTLLNEEMKK
uniref:Uncharacterized protein n=1 Tax=Thermofilum adornatum TaxID=1365176 RepID=A0A7C1CGM1_9CREN